MGRLTAVLANHPFFPITDMHRMSVPELRTEVEAEGLRRVSAASDAWFGGAQ